MSARQNEEHIFYIGNCPVCYEYGRLEIDKDINTGKCFIYCEECLAEWDSPQDALKNVNGRRNFQGGPVRGASLEEIVGLEWDKYVVEASLPEDLEVIGMYEKVRQLIDEAVEEVDFAEYGNGIADEWIETAEKRLDVVLPDSYKWWLRNYGGGEICGEEIYSIYGQDFDEVVGGDIVYINELSRKDNSDWADKLIICEPADALFYFDLTQGLYEGEYPVYEYFSKSCYASNFIEFLKRRIEEI